MSSLPFSVCSATCVTMVTILRLPTYKIASRCLPDKMAVWTRLQIIERVLKEDFLPLVWDEYHIRVLFPPSSSIPPTRCLDFTGVKNRYPTTHHCLHPSQCSLRTLFSWGKWKAHILEGMVERGRGGGNLQDPMTNQFVLVKQCAEHYRS